LVIFHGDVELPAGTGGGSRFGQTWDMVILRCIKMFQLLFGRILLAACEPSRNLLPPGRSRAPAMHGTDEHLHFEGEAEKEVEEGHGCPVPWLLKNRWSMVERMR